MSVEYIRLRRSRTFSANDRGELGAERTYIAKTTVNTDGPEAVLVHADCPQIGEAFSVTYPTLVVADVDCDENPDSQGTVFEVKVRYSTTTEDPEQATPPTERPIRVSMSFDSFEETLYQAQEEAPQVFDEAGNAIDVSLTWIWGNAVVNSAGGAFDPSITESYRDPVITIIKNYAEIPFDELIEYMDTINDDVFTITYRGNTYIIQPGQAWLAEISHSGQYDQGEFYEEVTWVFKLRFDGWRRKVLDQGLEDCPEHSPAFGSRKIPDLDGEAVQEPQRLDGQGTRIGGVGANDIKAAFISFRTKRLKSFSALPI